MWKLIDPGACSAVAVQSAGDPHPGCQLGALERGNVVLPAARPHPLGSTAGARRILRPGIVGGNLGNRHAAPGDRAEVDDLGPSLETEAVQAEVDLVEAARHPLALQPLVGLPSQRVQLIGDP
ncbi:MAG TPA: hypothetical protein VGF91_04200 [Solirubrobacteraceae bacterium]